MMKFLSIIVCFLCVNNLMASETYKAGVLHLQNKDISECTPLIYEASNTGVDIIVLPVFKPSGTANNYDEAVKTISAAAKKAGLYVVAHLYEKTRCQLAYETFRSNLVFDRSGSIVAVKPLNGVANCTTTSNKDLVTFTADFGVTFGVLMEEDLIGRDIEFMKGVKNYVMTGDWHSEVPFLNAVQFAPSWTYVNNINLVSPTGVYAGKAGLKTNFDKIAVAELHQDGENGQPKVPAIDPATLNFPAKDLSSYVLSPLNLDASANGYQDFICHRGFCCQFYVKAAAKGVTKNVSYNLGVFNGIHPSSNQNIGVQICGLFTCTEVNQKSCAIGSESKTSNIVFERISIAANFTKQNAQYPIVHSTTAVPTEKFEFNTKTDGISQEVTLGMVDTKNLVNVGIFGMKDMEKDNVASKKNSTESLQNEFYEYIFNDDVQEFFDYVWIRIRILIVVVSIYVLEMM